MLIIQRSIHPTDKLYTKEEFLTLIEKNKYRYMFEAGEAHYAVEKHIFITYVGGKGELVKQFLLSNPNITHIAILSTPKL